MHVQAVVSAFILAFLSVLAAFGSKGRALAEGVCVEQPGRDAPQGEHWYYHFDRQKNRKCWHLGSPVAAREMPPAPRTERPRSFASTLNSVFGPLLRSFRRMFRQPMPHEAAAGEPRIVQSDATKPLTIEDIAQPPADLPEERAEARPASSLSAAQRRALFEEYLKWEELQRNPGGSSGNAGPAPARTP